MMLNRTAILLLCTALAAGAVIPGCSACSRNLDGASSISYAQVGDPDDYVPDLPSSSLPDGWEESSAPEPESEPALDLPALAMSADFLAIGKLSNEPVKWGPGTIQDDLGRSTACTGLQDRFGKYNACFIGAENEKTIALTFDQGYDLVYGYYPEKKHNWFRNLGSKFNDLTINMMINKPKDVRTSSYFLVRKFVRDYAIQYKGSYTYLLGLFMRCTQNIASVPIRHFEREVGESGYTLGQLIRLWSSVLGFSVIPLRMASIAGFFFAGVGFIMAIVVFLMKFMRPDMSMGWPSLMCAITFFFGLNFMFLGMIGEYLGRMFLGMNREPQYVIKAMYNVSASAECDVDIDREVNRGEEIF